MKQKYDEQKERQLKLLAENRIKTGNYKLFDGDARVITRTKIDGKNCLVIANAEGETIVITPLFEIIFISPKNKLQFRTNSCFKSL